VDKKSELRLTGPVNHGVLFKVICFAQNPPAAMRGGFLRWDVADIRRSLQPVSKDNPKATAPHEMPPQAVQLKCVGWNGCQNGGNFGHGGMYSVGGQTLCESCAVKKLGGELLPSNEKTDHLRPYLIGGGK
jgi:hypothetical protein